MIAEHVTRGVVKRQMQLKDPESLWFVRTSGISVQLVWASLCVWLLGWPRLLEHLQGFRLDAVTCLGESVALTRLRRVVGLKKSKGKSWMVWLYAE